MKGMTRAGGCAQYPIKGTMLGWRNLQNYKFITVLELCWNTMFVVIYRVRAATSVCSCVDDFARSRSVPR